MIDKKTLIVLPHSDWHLGTKRIDDKLFKKLLEWAKSTPLSDCD